MTIRIGMKIALFALKSKCQDLYLNENVMNENDTIRVKMKMTWLVFKQK